MAKQRIALQEHMQTVLCEFTHVLDGWKRQTDQGGYSLWDPFEIHYGENYAPACAAVIYASAYAKSGASSALKGAYQMVERSIVLFEDKRVMPFCRVFLIHYSLMAIHLLPEKEKKLAIERYGPAYAAYVDDCAQVNTNCAALQLGSELTLEALGMRKADPAYVNMLIKRIEDAQNQHGFINDEVDHEGIVHDGMPIAYHLFTCFILTSQVTLHASWPAALTNQKSKAEDMIRRGIRWMESALTPDGTMAMAERSSYQTFTWGALVAVLSYTGVDPALLRRSFEYWLQYRQDDGSYGCTPNYLPHTLRVGYENYTHVNMYNNLGLAAIAVAERILEQDVSIGESVDVQSRKQALDEDSGYAFHRSPSHSFGIVLRVHHRRYTPSMPGFHYRLDGVELPLAETRMPVKKAFDAPEFVMDGVWEGFLLRDEQGKLYYPSSQDNAQLSWLENGVRLVYEDANVRCEKTIECIEGGYAWHYHVIPKAKMAACLHILPLLMHDGRHATQVVLQSNQILEIHHKNRAYLLTCEQTEAVIAPALDRSMMSGSGVAAQVRIPIEPASPEADSYSWTTRLVLRATQPARRTAPSVALADG